MSTLTGYEGRVFGGPYDGEVYANQTNTMVVLTHRWPAWDAANEDPIAPRLYDEHIYRYGRIRYDDGPIYGVWLFGDTPEDAVLDQVEAVVALTRLHWVWA